MSVVNTMAEKAAQCEQDPGDIVVEVEGAEEEERTFRNRCVGVRANVENKIYRMFSMVYCIRPNVRRTIGWSCERGKMSVGGQAYDGNFVQL